MPLSNTAKRVIIGMIVGALAGEVWQRYDKYQKLKARLERIKQRKNVGSA
jgi:hypothetical protein